MYATCTALVLKPAAGGNDAWAPAHCNAVRFKRMTHGERTAYFTPGDSAYLGGHDVVHARLHTHELALADVYAHVLGPGSRATPETHFHVDVGCDVSCNAGLHTAAAAAYEFSTLAVDMQPECARLARCAGTAHTDASEQPITVHDCDHGGVTGSKTHGDFVQQGLPALAPRVDVGRAVRRRTTATGRRIALLQINVGGGEPIALASLAAAGALHLIDHIIVEMMPQVRTAAAGACDARGIGGDPLSRLCEVGLRSHTCA